MRPVAVCFSLFVSLFLTQCVQPGGTWGDSGGGVPDIPTVRMPAPQNTREQQFAPRLEQFIRSKGLEPVHRGRADQYLELTIEEGPINVDTTIRLTDNGRVVAFAAARSGGAPWTQRDRVAEDSFNKALSQFENQMPSNRTGYSNQQRYGDYPRYPSTPSSSGYSSSGSGYGY